MILHGYYRSTASWRVRIALAIKGLAAEPVSYHLRRGEQLLPGYRAINPQALVPTLQLDHPTGVLLTQSLAICEYLEEIQPTPPLLPIDPLERARVRAIAQIIASDIHPIQNLKILARLRKLGLGEDQVTKWAHDVIAEGLAAIEILLGETDGPFAFGAAPTLADICLVPQMYNARRFGVTIDSPRLSSIEKACLQMPAFIETRPETQPDAEA